MLFLHRAVEAAHAVAPAVPDLAFTRRVLDSVVRQVPLGSIVLQHGTSTVVDGRKRLSALAACIHGGLHVDLNTGEVGYMEFHDPTIIAARSLMLTAEYRTAANRLLHASLHDVAAKLERWAAAWSSAWIGVTWIPESARADATRARINGNDR